MPCPELSSGKVPVTFTYRKSRDFICIFVYQARFTCMYIRCPIAFVRFAAYSPSFGTVFAAAASLNFLHALRCPPCFQWFTWHSRPQYCTVWHNLQGFNGRKGVLGLPHVEQQRIVGVVRPSYLSNC